MRLKDPNHLELLVLVAMARLGDTAYGVTIRQEITGVTGRDVSMAAVYAALDRLERHRFVNPWWSEPRAERGGRARRQFRLTADARAWLRRERQTTLRMWRGVTLDAGERRR
ncbi:MAG TPA: PadR family transcriptional regulator [Vicinamibacterales bacterium]|jgi:DNA-binding PadR family transcriptional regulator